MSMLAEPKRKQKWSLNPRGKEWSQDANKFGQKLLEKMGWQHGKGLGAKEDGITEHVKVSHKNDIRGIGYKESNDQWTEHESNFSALLESLTGKERGQEEIKVTSLEQKSQISRARVHYHKFTRGKDLSRASEKDLANIFGKKSLKELKKKEVMVEKDSDSKESKNNSGMLVNAGSMKDYFKKKLPNFGRVNGYVVGNNGVLKKEDTDSESELKPSFGFGFNSTVDSASETFSMNKVNSDTELKKSKSKSPFVSYITENADGKRKAKENEDTFLSPIKKIKKEEKAVTEDNLGLSNPAFNPMATPIKIKKHLLDPIEESLTEETDERIQDSSNEALNSHLDCIEESSKKKKKKKKTSEYTSEFSNPNFNEEIGESQEEISGISNPYEVITKKLKNKNKKKQDIEAEENVEKTNKKVKNKNIEIDNPSFEEKNDSFNISQVEENPYEATATKLKKKKRLTKEIDNPIFNNTEDTSQIQENPYEVKPKKIKKKKKIEEDNPNFDETEDNDAIDSSQIEENPYEVKPKKNKKQKIEVDNPNFDETEDNDAIDSSQIEENPYEVKPKKNKKQKIEVDNPNFDETEDNDAIDSSQIEENPYEVKPKKNKKQKIEVDNPNFDETEDNDAIDSSQIEENPYEVKPKKKNKKQKKIEVDNPNFDETEDNVTYSSQIEENPYEIKQKKKKKNKHLAVDNPIFTEQEEIPIDILNPYEVKSNKLKKKDNKDQGIANPALDLNYTKVEDNTILEDCELMLNVVSTPVIPEENNRKIKSVGTVTKIENFRNRKSVRFSDITRELIIPNNEELKEMHAKKEKNKKNNKGLDNLNFDKQLNSLDENVDTISKTLDKFQAEIENDMNEEKMKTFTVDDIMVGEVGNPHGENKKLKDGTMLKFKYANLNGKTPFYLLDKVGPKKSYKHLIKGDILVKFKNTNLHEVKGYAAKNKTKN